MGSEVLKTYRGVYLKIEDSDICSFRYGMYFYFCSEAMKLHFEKHLDNYIAKSKKRIQSVIPNVGLETIDNALAVEYYIYLEKRGFRIETLRGVKIKKAHLIGDLEFEENKEE